MSSFLRRWWLEVLLCIAGLGALVFLYFVNPGEVPGFPRCPFLLLTHLQCPGCGTLRCINSLLHGHWSGFGYNPILLLAIPAIAVLLLFRRARESVKVAWAVLIIALAWWIIRNLPGMEDFFLRLFQ